MRRPAGDTCGDEEGNPRRLRDAAAVDPGGLALTLSWDFGDGAAASGWHQPTARLHNGWPVRAQGRRDELGGEDGFIDRGGRGGHSGRTIVFWVDPKVATPASELSAYQSAFCGAGGGYDRVTSLLGDTWDLAAASRPILLIQDSPTLQDVNIVFPNVPTGTNWGGYFYAYNARLDSANQALASSSMGRTRSAGKTTTPRRSSTS